MRDKVLVKFCKMLRIATDERTPDGERQAAEARLDALLERWAFTDVEIATAMQRELDAQEGDTAKALRAQREHQRQVQQAMRQQATGDWPWKAAASNSPTATTKRRRSSSPPGTLGHESSRPATRSPDLDLWRRKPSPWLRTPRWGGRASDATPARASYPNDIVPSLCQRGNQRRLTSASAGGPL